MTFHVPLIIRGRIIEDPDLSFGGRRSGAPFTTPDVRKHLTELALEDPAALEDIHALKSDEIFDYLDALGQELNLASNPYLQEAYELSIQTSGLSAEIVRHLYSSLGGLFSKPFVRFS